MPENNVPNPASNKSKAEGERDAVNTGGITNRPLSEEEEDQAAVPERGESKEGAHAGHGNTENRHPTPPRFDRGPEKT